MSTYDSAMRSGAKASRHATCRQHASNYNCDMERITVRRHLTHTAQGKFYSAALS
jgi:hypothetical protein